MVTVKSVWSFYILIINVLYRKTKAELEADAFAAKTFSAYGLRSVEVIETRLRRALRGVGHNMHISYLLFFSHFGV